MAVKPTAIPPIAPLAPLNNSVQHKSNDGFLGSILAIPGNIVDDAKDIATGFIPGLIETGKAFGSDIGNLAHGDASFSNSEKIAVAVLKGIAEDFQHPLRHPLNTLLDVWGIASGGAGLVARGAEASRAAAAGENVAKALLKGPAPETRMMRLEGAPDLPSGTYSRNALTRQIQKGADAYRFNNPDARLPFRTQTQRYGVAQRKFSYEFAQRIERAAADELRVLGRKLNAAEQTALRLYAENTPVEARLAYHDKLIADLDKLGQRNTNRTKALLTAAKDYLTTDARGNVQWAPGTEKLQEVYGKMEAVVKNREAKLVEAGLMTPEGVVTRTNMPGRVIAGARYFERGGAEKTKRFLDGRLTVNDSQTRLFADQLDKAVTAKRAPSGAKKSLADATARVKRIQERIDRDQPHMNLPVEERSIAVMNRYFNNTRKLIEAQKQQEVHRARLAISAEKDPVVRQQIAAQARDTLNRLRDGQQSAILMHKRMLSDFAGKMVGGDTANPGRLMVPYANKNAVAAVFRVAGLGSRGVVGVPKPGSWLRPFKGSLLAKGGGRYDTLALQAERTHEAVRYIALVKFRHDLIALSKDTPTGMREPVAMRLDALKNKPLPADVRQILSKVDDDIKLSKKERELLGTAYEDVRDAFFDAKAAKQLDMESYTPNPGVRWIERDMLGGLDKPSPLVGLDSGAGRIVLRAVDEINSVAKFITLYLRPATLFPNLLSGVALNLIQQGFLAPANLARTFTLHRTLTPAARSIMDQLMGEGRAAVLKTDRGVGSAAVNLGATVFGNIQDLPFRRSAFLHEARREGYRKAKDVERLLTDPQLRDTLYRVQDRANRAIIDYSNLGKFERDLLRRAFYFYPWLKGATMYSGKFLADNPVQALAAGQLGQQGTDVTAQQFGDLPSWAQGLYQVGSRDGMPLTVQTGNVLPFGTAADMAGTLLGLVRGGASPAQQLTANLSPTASAFLAALTGKSALGATLPQRGFAEQFARQLWDNTTLASLIKKTTQDQTGKSFPVTPTDALLGYLLGNTVYARPADTAVLNSLAAKEKANA